MSISRNPDPPVEQRPLNPLGIPSRPPLVGSRRRYIEDGSLSDEPLPNHVPEGWESIEYPKIDSVEAGRDWLKWKIKKFEDLSKGSGKYACTAGVEITDVRDAHRLARHFAKQDGWQGELVEPEHKFIIPAGHQNTFFEGVANKLRNVLDWINERLAGVPKATFEQSPNVTEPLLTVPRWSDLAIGIDKDGSYWALPSLPDVGSVFPKEKAVKLRLAGDQWKHLLSAFANSEDGKTALKKDLHVRFEFVSSDLNEEETLHDLIESGHGVQVDGVMTRLSNAIRDLGSKLRTQVRSEDYVRRINPPISAADSVEVKASFSTRHLLRDHNGKLRFGSSE